MKSILIILVSLLSLTCPLFAQDTIFVSQHFSDEIVKAKFPGGEGALFAYINEQVKIPQQAIDYGISGTVVVRIFIDTSGRVSKANIVKGLGFGCDEEALSLMQSLPIFEPAYHSENGKKYIQEMIVPVKFKAGKTIDNIYFNITKVHTTPEINTIKGRFSFEEYLRSVIKFPEGEKRKITSVQLLIKVDKNGGVQFEISSNVGVGFQKAIEEAISQLPEVIPATIQNANVNCQFFMELYFYPDKK